MKDRKWRVLLLDDEAYMLDMLKTMIQWDFYGFELVGTALSAAEAMELYYEKRPEIIITDICMDGVNGIEFLNKIRLQDAKVKLVILSAHDKFEYAQKALKLNVDGYLLKPVSQEELLGQLLEIQRKLILDEDYEEQLQTLQKSLGELEEKYRRSQLLNVWQKDAETMGKLSEDRGAWAVLAIRTIIRDEIVFLERELKGIPHLKTDVIFSGDGEFGIFLNSDEEAEVRRAAALVREKYCENARSVLCGASSLAFGTEELARLCRESRKALDQLFYEDGRFYLTYREKNQAEEASIQIEENQFLLWILNGESENWKKALDEMAEALRRRCVSREAAVKKFAEVKDIAARVASDRQQTEKLEELSLKMERACRMTELKNLAGDCIEVVNTTGIKGKKNRKLILNAREYMKEHFFEETFSIYDSADH